MPRGALAATVPHNASSILRMIGSGLSLDSEGRYHAKPVADPAEREGADILHRQLHQQGRRHGCADAGLSLRRPLGNGGRHDIGSRRARPAAATGPWRRGCSRPPIRWRRASGSAKRRRSARRCHAPTDGSVPPVIALVATGLFPVSSFEPTFAIVVGTSIAAAFAAYVGLSSCSPAIGSSHRPKSLRWSIALSIAPTTACTGSFMPATSTGRAPSSTTIRPPAPHRTSKRSLIAALVS